jgi:hypothetical protein
MNTLSRGTALCPEPCPPGNLCTPSSVQAAVPQRRASGSMSDSERGATSNGAGAAAGEAAASGFRSSGSGSGTTFSGGSSFEERLPTEGWQGRKTQFMQSNEHSRERERGVWDTRGLQGALLMLVEGDRDNGRCGRRRGGGTAGCGACA